MSGWQILYGDIHNHNAHGYGVGSIERSLDIARTHLDFFAFTGHSSWHDMPAMEGQRERHWIDGFKRLKDTWPRVQQVIADGNRDGAFCAFLGFEWHSSHWGDQCVVFPRDHRPLHYTAEPRQLRRFCAEEGALMIPHHLAYPGGSRGVNWECFHEDCTPVVEVYSEHGNGEDDRGPLTYFSHSMGGRQTSNTAAAGLKAGLRLGHVAGGGRTRGNAARGSRQAQCGVPQDHGHARRQSPVRDVRNGRVHQQPRRAGWLAGRRSGEDQARRDFGRRDHQLSGAAPVRRVHSGGM